MKSHEHSFDSIKIVDIEIDNPKYSIGENGVWAFLVRYCECNKEEVFEYAHRKEIQERLDLILERG